MRGASESEGIARELGFLPHAEAMAFPWSKRVTALRVLEALLEADKLATPSHVLPETRPKAEADWTA